MNINVTELPEQLFLGFTVQEVAQRDTREFLAVEPWASEYVAAIQERRFDDSVWARYHISGNVHEGIIEGSSKTVLEMTEEDALGYRVGHPDLYAEAPSSVYKSTNTLVLQMDIVT